MIPAAGAVSSQPAVVGEHRRAVFLQNIAEISPKYWMKQRKLKPLSSVLEYLQILSLTAIL